MNADKSMAEQLKDVTPPRVDLREARSLKNPSHTEVLSQTLRKMAVKARGKRRLWTPNYVPVRRLEHSFNAYIAGAFIALVVVPVLLAGLYLAFFISDQYSSEARFAVRGAERASFDPIASLTGVPSTMRIQEATIISEFIRGRGIIDELQSTINLREKFSGPNIDVLSRFNKNDAIEELVKFWRWHVDVSIDAMTGILTVTVYAFTPQDALEIANAILGASERLVNQLSDRSRRDALRQTQNELKVAEAGLQSKIRSMQDLRNAEGLLDADKTSDAMIQIIGGMRLELARMDREYNAQRQTVAQDSPQLRVLESRIKATREQIRQIENQMTGTSLKDTPALAESMSRFERAKLDHDIAQKRYVAAAASFEKARVDLSTQQIYLTTFVPPTLAQDPLYPRRMWMFVVILIGCSLIWGLVTGAAVLVRNHMA